MESQVVEATTRPYRQGRHRQAGLSMMRARESELLHQRAPLCHEQEVIALRGIQTRDNGESSQTRGGSMVVERLTRGDPRSPTGLPRLPPAHNRACQDRVALHQPPIGLPLPQDLSRSLLAPEHPLQLPSSCPRTHLRPGLGRPTRARRPRPPRRPPPRRRQRPGRCSPSPRSHFASLTTAGTFSSAGGGMAGGVASRMARAGATAVSHRPTELPARWSEEGVGSRWSGCFVPGLPHQRRYLDQT